MRPKWQDLPSVEDGHLLVRFLRPNTYDLEKPKGMRVLPATCPTNEFTPNDKSYGPSVFVEEKLANGMSDLLDACPRWRSWIFVRIPVVEVRALIEDVKYSPMDCTEFPTVAHAHATLIGVSRANRPSFLALLESRLE
jgi:hypothetical protein